MARIFSAKKPNRVSASTSLPDVDDVDVEEEIEEDEEDIEEDEEDIEDDIEEEEEIEDEEEDTKPVVKSKSRTSKKSAADKIAASTAFNPYAHLDDVLDNIEKSHSLSNTVLDKNEQRTSTGLLVLDIILGGGIVGGAAYTVLGEEQSAKSTLASTIMTNMMNTSIPVVSMVDAEGSSSVDYIESIMQNFTHDDSVTIEDLFGLKNSKNGKWIKKPRVRYYAESGLEKVFDYIASLQRSLPDKVKVGDDWYLVYEPTKENQKLLAGKYDKEYYRSTGKYRMPADNSDIQGLVIIDSYPSLLPAKMDAEEIGGAMAIQARAYSEQTKRIKGRMRPKRMTLIGINQMRLKPGVTYGNPSYEPCGQSLKHFSDARLQLTSRAISGVPSAKGKGQIEEEGSVTIHGAIDQYRYIHVRAIKNKLSAPYLEGWLRLWLSDGQKARGFDLVWDSYQYLLMTGQAFGKRDKLSLRLIATTGQLLETKKPLSWLDFKTLIIGDKSQIARVCEKIGIKPFFLRKFLVSQSKTGMGCQLYFDNKLSTNKHTDTDSDEDGDRHHDDSHEDYDDGLTSERPTRSI